LPIFWSVGCSVLYVPEISTKKQLEIPPELAPKEPISLINVQSPNANVKIGASSHSSNSYNPSVTTNLRNWTDVVISYVRKGLELRSIVVNDHAPKWLRLDISTVKMSPGYYLGLLVVSRPSCEVELKIETGNSYVTAYHVEDKSAYGGYEIACESATRMAAASIFQDAKVIQYLNE